MIKALYGLIDAPKLWLEEILSFLRSLGFMSSCFDECTLYSRQGEDGSVGFVRTGTLLLMVTVHVDDMGMTGLVVWLDWLEQKRERQRNNAGTLPQRVRKSERVACVSSYTAVA